MATQRQKKAIKKLEVKSKPNDKDWLWNYIYLIKCDEFYKIGIAWDIDSRLNSLQCGNPYELELMVAKRVKNAKTLELKLHELVKDKRVFREWFKLDDNDILKIKEIMEKSWQNNE